MKKSILIKGLLCFCLISNSVSAQIEVDPFLLSTELNLSTSSAGKGTNEEQTSFSFEISPRIGYIHSKNIVMGIGFRYYKGKSSFSADPVALPGNPSFISTSSSDGFSLSPQLYVEYYGRALPNFFWSIPLSIQYTFSDNASSFVYTSFGNILTTIRKEKQQSYSFRITPTFRYQLFKKLGLQVGIGEIAFEHFFKNSEGDKDLYFFGANMNWTNWRFGIYTTFGNKKNSLEKK